MIEYYLIEFNIKIKELKEEIKELKEEIKELKEEIKELKEEIKELKEKTYNKCFVDTDEEHNQSESEDNFNYKFLTKRVDMLYEDVERLKKENNYLMMRQKEREIRISKFFTYDSTDSDSEGEHNKCGCGKEPHKQDKEIEDYFYS